MRSRLYLSSDRLMISQAFRVIAENFQDSAVRSSPPPAFFNHPGQFGSQHLKPGYASLDLDQLSFRDRVSLPARSLGIVRQFQQLADRIKREAELATVPNE